MPLTQPLFFRVSQSGTNRLSCVGRIEAAELLADRVRALADDIGVPRGLAELGVTETVLPQLAQSTLADACLATNPRASTADEIEALFRAAL